MAHAAPALAARPQDTFPSHDSPIPNEAHSSGVSWAAVFAGAFVAAALSVILLALGTGLGLSSVSPWSGSGVSGTAVKAGAIVWLFLMQIISCAFGGYLAGRLRTKWAHVHNDEVYFRDTAHGLLVWAVGLVLTASFLTAAAASMMGSAAATAPGVSRSNDSAAQNYSRVLDPNQYFTDALFRSESVTADRNDPAVRGEAAIIFANALRLGALPQPDKTYLAHVVSARAGINQAEAERRVSNEFLNAQEAADTTRKAVAHLSLWLFAALLTGAFCASLSATFGGRERDLAKVI